MLELADGRILLFDYANMRDSDDKKDKRIDLPEVLGDRLKALKKTEFDVVAFTHADDDHIHGSSEFFFLQHAEKYQSEDRVKIKELWVPAAMIIEEGVEDEAKILRAEARHRLKQGKGIRVFSRPELLEDWLKAQKLTLEPRRSLISDAGTLVPGFDKSKDGVEFFVHSPFAKHVEDGVEDRNAAAIILHVTFLVDGVETRMFLVGDTTYEVLKDIVAITKSKKRMDRIQYDIYDIPHHCSYLALSDEKGEDETKPDPDVAWMMSQGNEKCLLVSCSDPIPTKDTTQPPHKQAAKYYQKIADEKMGQFNVTMQHPSTEKPEPLVITIGKNGYEIVKAITAPFIAASKQVAPRAGRA